MEIKDYPPNNNYSKPSEPTKRDKLDAVTTAAMVPKNESILVESMKSVLKTLWNDTLKPIAKNTLYDMVESSARGLIKPTKSYTQGNGKTAYNKVSEITYNRSNGDRVTTRDREVSMDYKDVIFEDESKANEVLAIMDELIDTQGYCSLADYMDLCGLSKYSDYTDEDWGWENVRTAKKKFMRNGVKLILPRLKPVR